MKKYIWQEILNNLDMVKQCVDCGAIIWAESEHCFNCENETDFDTNKENLKGVIEYDIFNCSDFETFEEFLLAQNDIPEWEDFK